MSAERLGTYKQHVIDLLHLLEYDTHRSGNPINHIYHFAKFLFLQCVNFIFKPLSLSMKLKFCQHMWRRLYTAIRFPSFYMPGPVKVRISPALG